MKLSAILIAALLSITSVAAFAHSGGTDSKVAIATIKPTTTTAIKWQKPSVRLGIGVSWSLQI